MKAMDDVDVGAADRIKWPRLVLAIFEIPLFMGAERVREQFADVTAETIGSLQRKEPETAAHDRSDNGRRPNMVFYHGAPFLK